MRKLLCRLFGHTYGPAEIIMFKAEVESETNYDPVLKCDRCGHRIIVHKTEHSAKETPKRKYPRKHSRKIPCDFCGAKCGSYHKKGCPDRERL